MPSMSGQAAGRVGSAVGAGVGTALGLNGGPVGRGLLRELYGGRTDAIDAMKAPSLMTPQATERATAAASAVA